MLTMLGILCAVVASVHGQDVTGNEPEKPSVDEVMAKFIKLGPGVYAIKKNRQGRITSCVAVGQARISTVLGKGKGLEVARQKADLDASAQFVKWLKEEVTVNLSSDEETVILLEGAESGEDDSFAESGKSVEKTSRKMQSVANGLIRGMQIIYKDVDGEGRTYTLIKGWKADNSEGVKRLRADLASDRPRSNAGEKKDQPTTASTNDKQIDSEGVASDDAADYLE
jgi:hypothetical protein